MSRGADGFSLLEAVVALAILGLATVASLSALAAELRSAERAQRTLEAAALAQDRVAALQLVRAEELRPLADSLARGVFAPPFDAYGWTAAVREVPGEHHLYEAEVRIAWGDGSLPVRTRLYRPPPRLP